MLKYTSHAMFRSFLFLTIVTVLTACSSGKTAFRRGKYDLAVSKAAHRLQQRPGLSKRGYGLATQVLRQAFVRAYEQHQTTIRKLTSPTRTQSSPGASFPWEAVHAEYVSLQTLTDNARRPFTGQGYAQPCSTCAEWLAAYPASYEEQQRNARELAAADRYEAAEQAFAYRENDRLAAKDAYLNYRKAAEWVTGYRQTSAKAEEAFPYALLRVVVEPLQPSPELSPVDHAELQDLILRQVGQNTALSTYVRIYPPDEQAGDGFPLHQAVQMQVTDYSPYNENRTSSSTTVYSNQAYKVGEKKINDSTKVDIMEKVSGTLTTYQFSISAGLTLRLRAVDTQSGKEIWNDHVWESRSWQTEWQTFSGDDRALNGQSLKSADPFPPSRGQLYRSMRDELANDVAQRLRTKYASD